MHRSSVVAQSDTIKASEWIKTKRAIIGDKVWRMTTHHGSSRCRRDELKLAERRSIRDTWANYRWRDAVRWSTSERCLSSTPLRRRQRWPVAVRRRHSRKRPRQSAPERADASSICDRPSRRLGVRTRAAPVERPRSDRREGGPAACRWSTENVWCEARDDAGGRKSATPSRRRWRLVRRPSAPRCCRRTSRARLDVACRCRCRGPPRLRRRPQVPDAAFLADLRPPRDTGLQYPTATRPPDGPRPFATPSG